MFPAGFWSRESVRRFALQLEGERWASACPPLTARIRRPRRKPLATDGHPAVFDMAISFLFYLSYFNHLLRQRLFYMLPRSRRSRERREARPAVTALRRARTQSMKAFPRGKCGVALCHSLVSAWARGIARGRKRRFGLSPCPRTARRRTSPACPFARYT